MQNVAVPLEMRGQDRHARHQRARAVGFNRTIVFAVLMVIIAAFIGTRDLGQELRRTFAATDADKNFGLGICVALMFVK